MTSLAYRRRVRDYIRNGPRCLVCDAPGHPPAAGPTGEGLDPGADDRDESDSCERGTPGCSVRHLSDSDCRTW
jgi:hypothetical protein